MHVLRLTAMGRVGHPDQQRLCDALAKLLETPEERAAREMVGLPVVEQAADAEPIKRGPGRPKKAA